MTRSAGEHLCERAPGSPGVSSRRESGLFAVPMFGLALGLLVLVIGLHAWPWVVDDAYISLRYARRFVAGEGLSWTDGERVEGYSNLLWVLLTAGLGWLGIDWVTAVRVLGLASTAGTIALMSFGGALGRSGPGRGAVLVFASLGATAVWAIGGLEVPLVACLLMALVVALQRACLATAPVARLWAMWGVGALLSLLILARPEGPLWAALAAVTVWWCRPSGAAAGGENGNATGWLSMGILVLGPPVLTLGLLTGFRLAYYGDWLPNTAYAKAAGSADSRRLGLSYLGSALLATRALALPALLGLGAGLWRARREPAFVFSCLGLVAWCGYLVQVGGDSFPRSRLFVPALVPMTILAANGFQLLATLLRLRHAAWVAVVAMVSLGVWDACRRVEDTRQQLTDWEWEGIAVGTWLGQAFPERPLLAVDAAGAVPFASNLPCLDLIGLCDATIARSPVPAGWQFRAAHSRGNGAYVFARQPDLLLFNIPPGSPQPMWISGLQLEAMPEFLAEYRCVIFQTAAAQSSRGETDRKVTLWARLGGKLGPYVGSAAEGALGTAKVVVPGFWFGGYRQPRSIAFYGRHPQPGQPEFEAWFTAANVALEWWKAPGVVGRFSAERGRVVGEVQRAGRHTLRDLALAPGLYTIESDLPAAVHVELADARGRPLPQREGRWVVEPVVGGTPRVDVTCDVPPAALPLWIDRVTLVRQD